MGYPQSSGNVQWSDFHGATIRTVIAVFHQYKYREPDPLFLDQDPNAREWCCVYTFVIVGTGEERDVGITYPVRLELHWILLAGTISISYCNLWITSNKRSMIRHSRRDKSHRDCRASSRTYRHDCRASSIYKHTSASCCNSPPHHCNSWTTF